jgi:hypothetical protein
MVVLALLPVIVRLIISLVVNGIRLISISDIITFGLVITITNIGGLETSIPTNDPLKTIHLGISIFLVTVFASLFTVTCIMELPAHPVEEGHVLIGALFLSIMAVTFSYMVWNRILYLKQDN